ncbi:MAG: EF-hand domain-containing protein [Candidatus Pacebacteria bacterium]|nr:EF-hand domain-containing protein [Candidatus Paceibacterota bacterium]
MEKLKAGFEKAMRNKLAQKATVLQADETVLLRSFKYFDIDNDGAVNLNEWLKVIEKIGVIVPSLDDLKQLFYLYDLNNDGRLDYKEFGEILYGRKEAK